MKITGVILLIFSVYLLSTSQVSQIRKEDKIRILEATNIAAAYGDSLWEGWNNVPFSILLVSSDSEYLIYHPHPVEGFSEMGFDNSLNSNIYYRARKFDTALLASFKAIDNIPSIVVGYPENTGAPSSVWVISVIHEHFHQLQYSQPDYDAGVALLDLSGGDNSGMWMLNYPFPYEDQNISDQFSNLLHAAMLTVLSKSDRYFKQNFKKFIEQREKFIKLLNEKDYRYYSFQIWQEGIARYTEFKILELIKDRFNVSQQMRALPDYTSMDSLYLQMFDKLIMNAEQFHLSEVKRVAFYTMGALEGLILDRVNPGWRIYYFKE